MSEDGLRYDLMVEDALRNVVRCALTEILDSGLPGEHHFYITFQTAHPGVQLAEQLKARYPDEMTIVLQHRYWDLEVETELFRVTLTFNDQPEHLVIPFAAVTAFADPSVRFGLQFSAAEGEDEDEDEAEGDDSEIEPESAEATEPSEAGEAAATAEGEAGEGDGGEDTNVVTLDTFRRKS